MLHSAHVGVDVPSKTPLSWKRLWHPTPMTQRQAMTPIDRHPMMQTTPVPETSARGAGGDDAGAEAMSPRMPLRIPRVLSVRRMRPYPMMQPLMAMRVPTAHDEVVTEEVARWKQMDQTRIQPLMLPKALVPILKQMTMMVVEIAAAAVAFAVPARLLHRS
jgi:hypothetical protein